MQKKLIALAVAAAISAPAFADDGIKASVYGVLDAGYGNESKTVTPVGGTGTKYDQSAFQFSAITSSRFGVLATEDIGDGTKATLKVETGIGSNSMAGFSQTGTKAAGTNGTTIDTTSLGNRELNLAVGFAEGTTVKAGFGSTLIRDISLGYAADPGGNLIGNILNNDAALGSNRATSLDVMQQSGPVKVVVSVLKDFTSTTTSTSTSNTDKSNGYLLGAQFNQDLLSISVALQSLKSTSPMVVAVPSNTATTPITLGANAVPATDTIQAIDVLGASYDLGAAKLIGELATISVKDNLAGVTTSKRSYESIGAQVPLGQVLAFVQLSNGKVDSATVTASDSQKITGYTVGAKYNLSKPTYAYLSAGATNLKAGTAASAVKVSQVVLGLVHTF